MKKLLLILLTALTLSASAQKGVYNWQMVQQLTGSTIHDAKMSGDSGMRIMLPWDYIQTTENDYSLTIVKGAIQRCADSGMNMELELWVGPDAPINNPTNWLRLLGVDTFRTTPNANGRSPGPYPDYYDSIYKVKYLKIHKALADTLFTLPDYQKAFVKSVFVCNGSTGDGQPIHGSVVIRDKDTIYENSTLWDSYKKVQWDSVWSYFAKDSGFMRLAFQPEDVATNLQYCLDHFPGAYLKHGSPTHEYPVDGQIYRRNWPNPNPNFYSNGGVYLGEVDAGAKMVSTTHTTSAQSNFQLLRSLLENHIGRVDFMPQWDTMHDRHSLVVFFSKYCSQFFVPAQFITKGFVSLADKIDFRDTINYPIGTYGALYNNEATYNSTIATINADGTTTEYQKQVKRTNAAINNRGTARINNLAAIGLHYYPISPFLYNDISWDNTPNYSLNITQKKINETSTGVWRVGDTTQSYGRNARIFKKYQGKYEMYFDINDTLATGNPYDNVKITVTYYDSGYTTWQVLARAVSDCRTTSKTTITNTNSLTFKHAVVTISRFQFGDLMPYGSDIAILILGKQDDDDGIVNFPVEMVEFENLSKE